MFRDYINNPIDPIPLEYVNTLNRLYDEPDYSLTCLGIALLKDRVEDYKGISGAFFSSDDEITCVRHFMERGSENAPAFYYYKYRNVSEENYTDELAERGFVVKKNIVDLIREKASLKCTAVYNEETNVAAIFINSSDIRLYHLLISFLSLYFPALFKDKPLQPDDYDIIRTLSKDKKDAFVQRIQEKVRKYTSEFRRLMLSTLLRSMHEVKINGAKTEADNARGYVAEKLREYSAAIHQMKQAIAMYEGLKATETYEKPEEELVEYLTVNKQIHGLRIEGNKMMFAVSALLNGYNADAWNSYSAAGHIFDSNYSHNGEVPRLRAVFGDKKNRKLLLDSIFSEEPEFAIKICGYYELDLYNSEVRTNKRFNFEELDPMFKSYLPNPHLKLYACLGGYEAKIPEAITERNFIKAVELCCASAGSVNVDETESTFKPFLGWVLSSNEKILRRKDGVEMTPEEALVYLIDKENNE